MHVKVAHAIEEIDAAVFSGDTFEDPAARVKLLECMAAWTRGLTNSETSGTIQRWIESLEESRARKAEADDD